MGALRRSRALCARPDSGGQDLLGVSQPQTTGDGRLFQRKIVGAATMPSRGRRGAPSWPEVRDESLCPGGASPPNSGRKAYCPGKKGGRCSGGLGKDMLQKGRVMPERSQGRLERRVGRDAADSAHGRVEGLQAPVGRGAGRTLPEAGDAAGPGRFLQGQKQETPQQRLWHFLRKESKLQWPL